ncbi:hypothetical protein GCM10009430_05720 [Aquimarina litoralis]|uniref:M23ase beta-sheet core domain-containing protein n=2 Tax=Aquimarina litoralis TaxID=584605 RepID=A0ABP3TNG4_9FLAO
MNMNSQEKFTPSYERITNGYKIIADNPNVYPITVQFEFKLKNLKPTTGKQDTFVVPANSKNYEITQLLCIKKGKSYTFSYSTRYQQGDHFLTKYDKEFAYHLPFSKDETHILYQGYDGDFSHQKKNALDFTMEIGTKIMAARGGTVVKVIDSNDKTCPKPKCMEYNNYIRIFHADGTFAEYLHIKKDGAVVKVGDRIEKGQLIAFSGNVGFSTGPHLHFEVYFQRLGERESLKTKFVVATEDAIEELVEKKEYTRKF